MGGGEERSEGGGVEGWGRRGVGGEERGGVGGECRDAHRHALPLPLGKCITLFPGIKSFNHTIRLCEIVKSAI